jgi:hypothetical protein
LLLLRWAIAVFQTFLDFRHKTLFSRQIEFETRFDRRRTHVYGRSLNVVELNL